MSNTIGSSHESNPSRKIRNLRAVCWDMSLTLGHAVAACQIRNGSRTGVLSGLELVISQKTFEFESFCCRTWGGSINFSGAGAVWIEKSEYFTILCILKQPTNVLIRILVIKTSGGSSPCCPLKTYMSCTSLLLNNECSICCFRIGHALIDFVDRSCYHTDIAHSITPQTFVRFDFLLILLTTHFASAQFKKCFSYFLF